MACTKQTARKSSHTCEVNAERAAEATDDPDRLRARDRGSSFHKKRTVESVVECVRFYLTYSEVKILVLMFLCSSLSLSLSLRTRYVLTVCTKYDLR